MVPKALEDKAEYLLRHVATDRLPVDAGAVAALHIILSEVAAAERERMEAEFRSSIVLLIGTWDAMGKIEWPRHGDWVQLRNTLRQALDEMTALLPENRNTGTGGECKEMPREAARREQAP